MLGKFLLNVVETYRVPSVNNVEKLHDEFKKDPRYELASFAYTSKYDKKADLEYQVVKAKKIPFTIEASDECVQNLNNEEFNNSLNCIKSIFLEFCMNA